MRTSFFIIICFFTTFGSSQTNSWWVFFTDKNCNSSVELSPLSLERRFQQKIPLDFYDLSLCDDYIDSLNTKSLVVRYHSRWLNAVSVDLDNLDLLLEISNYSFVSEVRPVRKLQKSPSYELFPESPLLNIFAGHRLPASSSFAYGSSFNQINMLGGVELHDAGFTGENILIAVFDAGFSNVLNLPIFQYMIDNNQIQDTYDFVDGDDDVFHGSFHGTMVLSTMAGFMLDSLIGTALDADYILCRTEDSASETLIEEDNWAAAAEYADSIGVHIINSSLGYTILYDDTLNSHTYADMDGNSTIITNAADLAASRGILVVNSAGNSGNNDWYYIGAPADGDSVLSVGAVDATGNVASFSSRGPSYDGRVKPNVCAQGVFSVVADLDSTIRVANGTSFSSPIIAGLAASLWESMPSATNMDIFDMIQESAHIFNNPNDSLGYGIPNFYQAYLNGLSVNNDIQDPISIYPNPNAGKYLYVSSSLNYASYYFLDIIDFSGRILKTLPLCSEPIDIGFLNKGIYSINIRNDRQLVYFDKLIC